LRTTLPTPSSRRALISPIMVPAPRSRASSARQFHGASYHRLAGLGRKWVRDRWSCSPASPASASRD
jgi:hypothetical protein